MTRVQITAAAVAAILVAATGHAAPRTDVAPISNTGNRAPACTQGTVMQPGIRTITSAGASASSLTRCTPFVPKSAGQRVPAWLSSPTVTVASTHKRARRRGTPRFPENDQATRQCVERVAKAFRVSPVPLYLILDVEGGKVGGISSNTNGTVDIGPMQINSWWLPKLARFGISRAQLRDNLCTNILAGAWIYAKARASTGTMIQAIARYHSPTPRYQRRYLARIKKAIDRRLKVAAAKGAQDKTCHTASASCNPTLASSGNRSPTPWLSASVLSGP